MERLVALHSDAVAGTRLREVVPHRDVLHTAIVPERHRVRLPAEPHLPQEKEHRLGEFIALGFAGVVAACFVGALGVWIYWALWGNRASSGPPDRWLNIVDEKIGNSDIPCIVNGGNDDTPRIDKVLRQSPYVDFAEGRVIDVGGFSLASCGWTNPTPWDTYREAPEEMLGKKIEAVADLVPDMGRAIFNFHAPPFGSGLDEAPALDSNLKPTQGGNAVVPGGSTAVREAILKHQPMLSLHGHIHESRGICKLGRTTSINPGSIYQDGVLQGVLLELNAKKGKEDRHLLVNG